MLSIIDNMVLFQNIPGAGPFKKPRGDHKAEQGVKKDANCLTPSLLL